MHLRSYSRVLTQLITLEVWRTRLKGSTRRNLLRQLGWESYLILLKHVKPVKPNNYLKSLKHVKLFVTPKPIMHHNSSTLSSSSLNLKALKVILRLVFYRLLFAFANQNSSSKFLQHGKLQEESVKRLSGYSFICSFWEITQYLYNCRKVGRL